jgi:hypothetical protein
MSRLATCGATGGQRNPAPSPRQRPIPIARCSTGVAAAHSLMGSGNAAGWSLPLLNGIPGHHQMLHGERIVARTGANLLRAGIAPAAAWTKAGQDPYEFLRIALEHCVQQSSSAVLREHFFMTLTLSSTVDPISGGEGDGRNLYLIADPAQAGYLVLGPTIKALEREHPRLPATFYRIFTSSLNRWVRVFDYQDALERNEMMRDWYEGDPDAASIELPDVDAAVPTALKRKPLSLPGLRQVMTRVRAPEVRRWLECLVALEIASSRVQPPELDPEIRDQLHDTNPPLPALLIVFRKHDAIEAAFDAEADGMLEVSPEPNLILPVRTDDFGYARDSFYKLGCFLKALSRASELMKLLPENDI